jgi:hypothetical protein
MLEKLQKSKIFYFSTFHVWRFMNIVDTKFNPENSPQFMTIVCKELYNNKLHGMTIVFL